MSLNGWEWSRLVRRSPCLIKDPSILNEFFTPLPSTSSMGHSDGATAASPTYMETFTNLEPYMQRIDAPRSPRENQPCYYELGNVTYAEPEVMKPPAHSAASRSKTPSGRKYTESPSEYRARRDKNNISSQRSRKKRQDRFRALKEEEVALKRKNAELVATVEDLERQVNNLKDIMMKAVSS